MSLRRIADSRCDASVSPVVSICCTTYNHEKFINEAIEGFLEQEVDFPVEIVVHDDCSSDKTQEIVCAYRDRYPSLFRVILQTTNQWELGYAASQIAISHCRGEYVAFCEGDDYWQSQNKLAAQVELLRKARRAVGCFHSADDLLLPENQRTRAFWCPPEKRDEYTLDDLLRGGTFASMASIMLRRASLDEMPKYGRSVSHMDFAILAWALQSGSCLYIDKPMSVYRRHGNGFHSQSYGVRSCFLATQSLINVTENLTINNRQAYLEGLRWRLSELEEATNRAAENLSFAQQRVHELQSNLTRVYGSRWWRLGVAIDRLALRAGFKKDV